MGNDLSIKTRDKDDKRGSRSLNKENGNSNVKNLTLKKFPTEPPSTNQIFIDKRKRFRELVSFQINKNKSINEQIIEIFYKGRNKRIQKYSINAKIRKENKFKNRKNNSKENFKSKDIRLKTSNSNIDFKNTNDLSNLSDSNMNYSQNSDAKLERTNSEFTEKILNLFNSYNSSHEELNNNNKYNIFENSNLKSKTTKYTENNINDSNSEILNLSAISKGNNIHNKKQKKINNKEKSAIDSTNKNFNKNRNFSHNIQSRNLTIMNDFNKIEKIEQRKTRSINFNKNPNNFIYFDNNENSIDKNFMLNYNNNKNNNNKNNIKNNQSEVKKINIENVNTLINAKTQQKVITEENSPKKVMQEKIPVNVKNHINNHNNMHNNKNKNSLQNNKDEHLIRNKFYTRLITNNCFMKKKDDNLCQNIFIFDWDDTIMCTTYITPQGYFTEKHLKELELKKNPETFKELEELIIKVLNYAISNGDTYIITNAASGWVEYSTRMFFPSVLSLLSKIIIISARSWFEKEFPKNSKMWKLSCFDEIGKIQNKKKITNLLVLGDSLIEMEAAYVMAKKFNKCFVKTIKLKDTPSPKQLIKQLSLLYNDFDCILQQHTSLAISVQKQKSNTLFNDLKSKILENEGRKTNYERINTTNNSTTKFGVYMNNNYSNRVTAKSSYGIEFSKNRINNLKSRTVNIDNNYNIVPRDMAGFK